jgi:hypothetical protein
LPATGRRTSGETEMDVTALGGCGRAGDGTLSSALAQPTQQLTWSLGAFVLCAVSCRRMRRRCA